MRAATIIPLTLTFHYTGCLIGILIIMVYNTVILTKLGSIIPYTPNKHVFFIAQVLIWHPFRRFARTKKWIGNADLSLTSTGEEEKRLIIFGKKHSGENISESTLKSVSAKKTSRNFRSVDSLGGYKQQFWNFHPDPWGNDPIGLIFFKWVETTN